MKKFTNHVNKHVETANEGLNKDIHYHVESIGRGRGNYHVAPPLNDKGRDYDACWLKKYSTADEARLVCERLNNSLAASR